MVSKSFLSFTLKFVVSKKATKIDEIFIVDLTIDGEDFVAFLENANFTELFLKKWKSEE